MTTRSAERITGLGIREIPTGGRHKMYGIYQPTSEQPLFTAESSEPGEAISRIVEMNYQRIKSQVFHEQRWRCFHCYRFGEMQCDHVKPRSKGRDDRRDNLRGLDAECHRLVTAGVDLKPHRKIVEVLANVGWRWLGGYDGPMIRCGWERIGDGR